MYISCLSSLTQSCEVSIFLHESKPSNQFSLKEKHVNHDLVLNNLTKLKTKKGYFCLTDLTQTQIMLVSTQTSYKNSLSLSTLEKQKNEISISLLGPQDLFFYFSFSSRNWRYFFIFLFLISKLEK